MCHSPSARRNQTAQQSVDPSDEITVTGTDADSLKVKSTEYILCGHELYIYTLPNYEYFINSSFKLITLMNRITLLISKISTHSNFISINLF